MSNVGKILENRTTSEIGEKNPWLEHLRSSVENDGIRKRAELLAEPIVSSCHFDMGGLKLEIDSRLKKIYVATDQECAILKCLVGIVASHYSINYPSMRAYNERLQSSARSDSNQPYSDVNALLLTGPSGCGKSATLTALARILLSVPQLNFGEAGMQIPCTPILLFKLAANSAEKHLVAEALSRLGEQQFSLKKTIAEMQDRLTNLMFAHGTALLILDELQFLSKSEGSVQKATSFLIDSLKLKVPVVYCANYTLIHKLMGRPSEEKQRLLSSVLELQPEASDSPDWTRLLAEVRKVAPKIFVFDPTSDAEQIFRWTAGLKRMLRLLLVAGYEQVCGDKQPRVTKSVLARAFMSASYTANRNDVEAIIRLGIQASNKSEYDSIRSPFPAENKAAAFHASLNLSRQKQDAESAAQSSMPHEEQLASIRALKSTDLATVKPFRQTRSNQTSEEKLATTRLIIEQSKKPARP